jgi:hypothetical protein
MEGTAEHPDVASEILAKLRAICLGLPEAFEEAAWVGVRWRIRKQTFAHVLMLDAGWPPAYAEAAKRAGPATLLTFRSCGRKLQSPKFTRDPFFRPVWFADIVGMSIDSRVDWDEVEELLAASYCILAPKKLARLVDGFDD